jgi:hypothetical protein
MECRELLKGSDDVTQHSELGSRWLRYVDDICGLVSLPRAVAEFLQPSQ